jgi:RPA family protein
MIKRDEVKKVFIVEIIRGRYFPSNSVEKKPAYIISPLGEKIVRVSIVGTIIEKIIGENFSSLTIDDMTEKIRVKTFSQNFDEFEIGEIVNVIGKVREYMGEIYLNAEIVRKVKPKIEIFEKFKNLKRIFERMKIIDEIRRIANEYEEIFAIEYGKEKYGLDEETIQQILVPKQIDYTDKILKIVKDLDEGEGVSAEEIFKVSALPERIIEDAISELLDKGKLHEPKPGRLKCV